jgi:hypothetical protein
MGVGVGSSHFFSSSKTGADAIIKEEEAVLFKRDEGMPICVPAPICRAAEVSFMVMWKF